ncbi:MAG TPA: CvpA family protein [Candidatus Sulfotelmatobacter sp.]|nr:CvpA family protein [Candidatus Sulfotelmatobacter sp.]
MMNFLSSITSLSIPFLGFNWIDIFILIVLGFYAFEGYSQGFLVAIVDFSAFVVSFALGLTFYGKISAFLVNNLHMLHGFANAVGFFIAATFFEVIFSILIKSLISKTELFERGGPKEKVFKRLNTIFGVIPGLLSGLLLTAFILSLIIALPFSVFLKNSVSNSKIGNILVENTQGFAKQWGDVFGGAVNDTLSFLTVEPKGNEKVNLQFSTTNVTVNLQDEQKMFQMVNQERKNANLSSLSFSETLAEVGRAHCKDMFARGYFSHYTPEGLSPFDRMLQANINFNYAGENLALSPNTELAMKGLMQSPGHRANILSQDYNKVGIGVIDGGVYGEMFCQEFTD